MTLPRTDPWAFTPDALDGPFWEGASRHEFLVHRCQSCGRSYWPATACIEHGGLNMSWEPASGRGVVHTYTVYHEAFDPAWAERVPYVVAVVRLEEGPFFHTDLPGVDVTDVAIGMAVHVVFEDTESNTIPHFVPD